MSRVEIVPAPPLEDPRRAYVLAEDRLGHYPEFREFFATRFALDKVGLATPGYLAAPSGTVYELIFIGRSGEAFPAALEIYAIVAALEPLDDDAVDRDLWAILRWIVDGVGGAWSVDALDATGRLYRLAVADPAIRGG